MAIDDSTTATFGAAFWEHEDAAGLALARLRALGFLLEQAAYGPSTWPPAQLEVIGAMVSEHTRTLAAAFKAVGDEVTGHD